MRPVLSCARRFSPRQLAEDIAASLVARTDIGGLSANVSIADDLPEMAKGDPVRLRAALENLIDNAVKFTARGDSLISRHRKARFPRKRVQLVFAISDSGIGMTPAEIKKLFRPFAQASEDVSRRFGGTGLGLVMVKRLAKAMDGDLTIDQQARRGAASFHADGPGPGRAQNLTIQSSTRAPCVADGY